MATIAERTGLAPSNSPLYGQTLIGKGYGKSKRLSDQSSSKPSPKVSLSDEQRAEAQKMKEAHIASLHRSSIFSQSATPEKPSS